MYSSCHISELLLQEKWTDIFQLAKLSCCLWLQIIGPSYPDTGVARQQSAYLAGSCHLCASHTLLRNRDWLISVWFMISVTSLSCSCGCPAAEQTASSELSSYIISRGSSLSFPNWVNLYFHSSPLSLWFSCSVHLFFLRSRDPIAPSRMWDTGLVGVCQDPTQSLYRWGKQDILPERSAFSPGFLGLGVNSHTVRVEYCSRHLPKFSCIPCYLGICSLTALFCVLSPSDWLLEVPQKFELAWLDSESEDYCVDYRWTTSDGRRKVSVSEGTVEVIYSNMDNNEVSKDLGDVHCSWAIWYQCDLTVRDWADAEALPVEKLCHLLQPFGENLSLLLLPLGLNHDYA